MKAKLHPTPSFDSLRYSINLAWINATHDNEGSYICADTTREDMDEILRQVNKWRIANPEAEINFWYDSECTNSAAIENTKKCLEEISRIENAPINLRDIREIPFVQANSDFFQSSIPIYFRVDFLKLIICLYLLEQGGMDSAIFADLSIGSEVETVISKAELYSPEKLEIMEQYGMLIGEDAECQAENQFIQTLRTEELILSLKHAINCCLFLTTNKLNEAIKKNAPSFVERLHCIPFIATMIHVYMYLCVLQSKEPVKIRADIVNEGNNTQWVDYNPEGHGYVMYGNYFQSGCNVFMEENGKKSIDLSDVVKLPQALPFMPGIIHFLTFQRYVPISLVRSDLNPGKEGSDHRWRGKLSQPTLESEFHCAFWPQENSEKNNESGIDKRTFSFWKNHEEAVDNVSEIRNNPDLK